MNTVYRESSAGLHTVAVIVSSNSTEGDDEPPFSRVRFAELSHQTERMSSSGEFASTTCIFLAYYLISFHDSNSASKLFLPAFSVRLVGLCMVSAALPRRV